MSIKAETAASDIVVTGATSQIGQFLLPRLSQAGHEVLAISRRRAPTTDFHRGQRWHRFDLQNGDPSELAESAKTLIHLAPLWHLPGFLKRSRLQGLRRVVAIGSTSLYTKSGSTDSAEKSMVRQLTRAEAEIQTFCQLHSIACTLFRPTLVYGAGVDKNVSFIAGIIERFHFFPIVSGCRGRRQPVHADDIATACLAVLENSSTFGKAYNLSGGETLSYQLMLERIFLALGKKPKLVHLPAVFYKSALSCLYWLPAFSHVSIAMIDRMNADLCFSHHDAARDFHFQPRKFEFSAANLKTQIEFTGANIDEVTYRASGRSNGRCQRVRV